MELKINEFQTPAPITFNYDELKTAVQKKADEYASVVYTEDKVKDAKKDRAELNKLKDTLNSERIRLQREYMKPFEDYKEKTNDLIGILTNPINLIDTQIKDFEKKEKDGKREEIELHFRTLDKPDWLDIGQIWNEKWLNKSYDISKIRSELKERVERIKNNLATLSNLSEFGFEACEVYKSTLDVNKAINEGKRLAEMQKRKEEQKRRVEPPTDESMKNEVLPEFEARINKSGPEEDFMNPPELVAKIYPVTFRVYMTEMQSRELARWFKERNINFEPIR